MPSPRTRSTIGPARPATRRRHHPVAEAGWSSRREANQPSSSTNRSMPMPAASSASSVNRFRSWSKYTASHTLQTTGRGQSRVRRQRAQVLVELGRPGRPGPRSEARDEYPWRGVGLALRRARSHRAAATRRRRARRPDGSRSTKCRELPLQARCTPQTSPAPKPNPAVPRHSTVADVEAGPAGAVLAQPHPVADRMPLRANARVPIARSGPASRSPARGTGTRTSKASSTYGWPQCW